jgi:hypothetical protein
MTNTVGVYDPVFFVNLIKDAVNSHLNTPEMMPFDLLAAGRPGICCQRFNGFQDTLDKGSGQAANFSF